VALDQKPAKMIDLRRSPALCVALGTETVRCLDEQSALVHEFSRLRGHYRGADLAITNDARITTTKIKSDVADIKCRRWPAGAALLLPPNS